MSTRKLSDKDFDRYARNLLKKPESIAFDKAAWAAMEQQLSQAGSTSSVFSLKWLISVGVIILIGLGYLTFQIFNDPQETILESGTAVENQLPEDLKNESLVAENSHGEDSLSNATSTLEKGSEKKIKNVKTDEKLALNPTSDEDEAVQVRNKVDISGSSNSSELPEEVIIKKTESASDDPISEKNDKADSNESESENFISQKESERLPYEENLEVSDGESKVPESKSAFIELPFVRKKKLDLTPVEIAEKSTMSDSSSEEKDQVSAFNRWGLGLTLAPDFSTVGQLSEFTQPGIDAGITVEYFITRRLSVTTGAILTRKLYNTTDISEYTIPTGFWNGVWAPEEIGADCRVIDIPINFRYRLVEGRRTSLFASAGISSYLMLNERYDYYYAEGQNNGNQPTGWEVSNENNHFFGVYNLSAGISRRVGRNIYIEAEPFLKNSLGGVGWGQVRLKSTGVLFHLKYNF